MKKKKAKNPEGQRGEGETGSCAYSKGPGKQTFPRKKTKMSLDKKGRHCF